MRPRACTGLLLLLLGAGGCRHLPEGVKIDLDDRVVEVGPCRCALPKPPAVPPATPAPEPSPESEPVPDDAGR